MVDRATVHLSLGPSLNLSVFFRRFSFSCHYIFRLDSEFATIEHRLADPTHFQVEAGHVHLS